MPVHRHPATERAGYSKEGRWIKNYIVPYLLYIIFELNLPSHLSVMHYLQSGYELPQVNRAFQRRWCVLRGNLLFYSANQGDR